jgi:pimeloyl-ACP methyl ester carboxylesterase
MLYAPHKVHRLDTSTAWLANQRVQVRAPVERPSPVRKTASDGRYEFSKDRTLILETVGLGRVALSVMQYGADQKGRRPLLILGSVNFPVPPSSGFCKSMWEAGFQVFFVQRPGFGMAPSLPRVLLQSKMVANGAAAATEATLIRQFIAHRGLTDIVLMGMRFSAPISYRLAIMTPQINFTILSGPFLNRNVWEEVRPAWLRPMLKQMLESRTGLKMAARGMGFKLRSDPIAMYRKILQQDAGDFEYLAQNESDFRAAAHFIREMHPKTFAYDLKMSFMSDRFLKTGFFENVNAAAIFGGEISPGLRSNIIEEGNRLSLPIEFVPRGTEFAPYCSVDQLIDMLHTV